MSGDALSPLTLVAAIGRNGVIGRAGQLPWNLPEDRAHFQRVKRGHAMLMGNGRDVVASLADGIFLARASDSEPMVVGGAEIFRQALPFATRLVLTEVALDPEGDTHFPAFDKSEWRLVESRPGDRAFYVTYERTSEGEPRQRPDDVRR